MKRSALLVALALPFASLSMAADAPPTEAVVMNHAKVDDAFAKGLPLLLTSQYKVQTGRRIEPGVAEIHDRDTDIFYITEGNATLVLGGTAVEPTTTAAGEIRAKSITGGKPHKLTKGDVVVIPQGVPHQFTEVTGTFLYFVIKVTK
ncbi:MAG: cupin domain-containing protein [Verrucomicrobia bacterium]|nr:cupin domain-containing protein [Verrucomicrobiota bacterium]